MLVPSLWVSLLCFHLVCVVCLKDPLKCTRCPWKKGPIAKGRAVQCLTLGRWFNSLSCHRLPIWPRARRFFALTEALMWLMVFRAPQQLVPCKCDQAGRIPEPGLWLPRFASVQSCRSFIPQRVLCCAFRVDVLIAGTTALYTAQKLGHWAGGRHHPVNITAVPVICMICALWRPQSHGLLCHRTGRCQLWGTADQGYSSLPVPSESAPVCCKPAVW